MIHIDLPATDDLLRSLKAGDIVSVSGTVYTARDAAHKRFAELARQNKPLPVDVSGAAIYYCGPTPALSGEVIGSCGPTTSSRMDGYTPLMLGMGLKVMIGKGKRADAVNLAIKQYGAVYLAAIGGAGALYKSCVTSCTCAAFEDLGCEAVYKLQVQNMQLIVATDSNGVSCLR